MHKPEIVGREYVLQRRIRVRGWGRILVLVDQTVTHSHDHDHVRGSCNCCGPNPINIIRHPVNMAPSRRTGPYSHGSVCLVSSAQLKCSRHTANRL